MVNVSIGNSNGTYVGVQCYNMGKVLQTNKGKETNNIRSDMPCIGPLPHSLRKKTECPISIVLKYAIIFLIKNTMDSPIQKQSDYANFKFRVTCVVARIWDLIGGESEATHLQFAT